MKMDAIISDCGTYRYVLTREWDYFKGRVNFIMLNPSTADASKDDPTIRRCIGFAKQWGYGRLVVTNLFAFRATNPKELDTAVDPIGEYNNRHIREIAEESDLVVAAWGNKGSFEYRYNMVFSFIPKEIFCLGVTKTKQPKHPLYVPNDTELVRWVGNF